MSPPLKFTQTTRRLLKERLALVLAGEEPTRVEKREFYYLCRKAFQDEWNLIEVDYPSVDKAYTRWSNYVNKWAEAHCIELGTKAGRFWDATAKLNIWAGERGTCLRQTSWGDEAETIVKHETKAELQDFCSFILVSEKASKIVELRDALKDDGYVFNLITTGGYCSGVVQAIAAEINDIMRDGLKNFYILVLHDYDLDGIRMVQTLGQWFPVLDVGINQRFFRRNGLNQEDLVRLYEATAVKTNPVDLRRWVKEMEDTARPIMERFESQLDSDMLDVVRGRYGAQYTVDELDELTGPNTLTGSRWRSTGKRIELDVVYAMYGVDPMVKYIEYVLRNDTDVWDLTRIGFTELDLEEGSNLFDKARDEFNTIVGKAYGEKSFETARTAVKIREIVNDNLKQPKDFTQLKKKYVDLTGEKRYLRDVGDDDKRYWVYSVLKVKGVDKLYDTYPTDKDYKEKHQTKVDEEINEMLTRWEDDPATAKSDIDDIFNGYQDELDEDRKNDIDLKTFKDKLATIKWGEEELQKIEPGDPVEKVLRVIVALREYVTELEAER